MATLGPPKSDDSDMDQMAESVDIRYIDTILLTLMRSSGNQIVLGREIILTLPKDKKGPHGSLDIIIGELDGNKILNNYCILAHRNRSQVLQLHCVDPVYTEAKNPTVSLCRLRPRVYDNTTYNYGCSPTSYTTTGVFRISS